MKCHTGLKKIQPTAMPTARPARALSSRERNSLMCSMSGIRPSGFRLLRAAFMRAAAVAEVREVVRPGQRSGTVSSRGQGSGGPLVTLRLRKRRVAHSVAHRVVRSWCRDRCRWLLCGRLPDRSLLRRLDLPSLVTDVIAVAESLRLSLEDTHRLAKRARRVGQLPRSKQHDEHRSQDQQVPRAECVETISVLFSRGLDGDATWPPGRCVSSWRFYAPPPTSSHP